MLLVRQFPLVPAPLVAMRFTSLACGTAAEETTSETCSCPTHTSPFYFDSALVRSSAEVYEPLKRQREYPSWTAIVPPASGSNPGYQPGTRDQSALD